MNDETLGALREVLGYLWDAEQRSWEEMGRPDIHIFHDLIRLECWLDEIPVPSDEELAQYLVERLQRR